MLAGSSLRHFGPEARDFVAAERIPSVSRSLGSFAQIAKSPAASAELLRLARLEFSRTTLKCC